WRWFTGFQFSSCKDSHKDGADANRAEMTGEQRLSPRLDIWNKRFERQHNRDTSEEYNEYSNNNKSPWCESPLWCVVGLPWDNRPKVNKVGQIEQQVDNVRYVRFLRLFRKPPVIREPDT